MPRPFEMPDPNDRSPSEPTVIMSAEKVLGFYNQENPDNNKERVVESVRDWTAAHAISLGWSKVEFSGNQAILTANVKLIRPEGTRLCRHLIL